MKEYLEKRIAELYKADSLFCDERWNTKNSHLQRSIAREWSNNVTFARQELQAALKYFNKLSDEKA